MKNYFFEMVFFLIVITFASVAFSGWGNVRCFQVSEPFSLCDLSICALSSNVFVEDMSDVISSPADKSIADAIFVRKCATENVTGYLPQRILKKVERCDCPNVEGFGPPVHSSLTIGRIKYTSSFSRNNTRLNSLLVKETRAAQNAAPPSDKCKDAPDGDLVSESASYMTKHKKYSGPPVLLMCVLFVTAPLVTMVCLVAWSFLSLSFYKVALLSFTAFVATFSLLLVISVHSEYLREIQVARIKTEYYKKFARAACHINGTAKFPAAVENADWVYHTLKALFNGKAHDSATATYDGEIMSTTCLGIWQIAESDPNLSVSPVEIFMRLFGASIDQAATGILSARMILLLLLSLVCVTVCVCLIVIVAKPSNLELLLAVFQRPRDEPRKKLVMSCNCEKERKAKMMKKRVHFDGETEGDDDESSEVDCSSKETVMPLQTKIVENHK